MEVESVIPIVRIFDLAKAREFYIDYLGFKQDWEHRFEPGMPVYMQVSRGNLVLHLSEHYGDCCPGSTVFVRVKRGLEEFHKEISAKKYGYSRPGIALEPWNAKSVEVADPFGNRIRFNEYLPEKEKQKEKDGTAAEN